MQKEHRLKNQIYTSTSDNLTEAMIKENWIGSDIQVSICCTAFNHELYIRDALEGFLSQRTDFAFEIIVHDDASADATPAIIMEYHQRYPNIIIPILQQENQYSKSTGLFSIFINPIIRGKYVAHCEGDDYWIDSTKLQKQYEALENNHTFDICFHPAKALYPDGLAKTMSFHNKTETVFPVGTVILGGGGFMPTASLFYRKEVRASIDDFHSRYGKFPVGDVMLQFLASLKGGALYLPIIGSVYRVRSVDSWSSRMCSDQEFARNVRRQTIIWNEKLNEFTHYEYNEYFTKKIQKILLDYVTNFYMEKDERQYFAKMYSSYLESIPKTKIKLRLFLRYFKKFIKQHLLKFSR